jgi:cytochrome c5
LVSHTYIAGSDESGFTPVQEHEMKANDFLRPSGRINGAIGLVFAASLFFSGIASAQHTDRSGKEVVDSVCIACHGTGAKGAPKIGDKKAWAPRADQGLSSLTKHALDGIRQMPPHGGNPSLSDTEIERAITYMVNQSGGHWTEPISRTAMPAPRTDEQIYQAQCSKCHQQGLNGAPRIGDMPAWIPRLKQGLDVLVSSAINGHGGMPPRGGQANLTDAEVRSAVVYLINPSYSTTAPKTTAAPIAGVPAGQDHRVADGTAVYFGIVPADTIRRNPKDYPEKAYGAPPAGPDQFFVTISLFDVTTGKRISDADVRARISASGNTGREKALALVSLTDAPSYGSYFALGGTGPFEIAVHYKRPGASDTIETKFEYAR